MDVNKDKAEKIHFTGGQVMVPIETDTTISRIDTPADFVFIPQVIVLAAAYLRDVYSFTRN